MLSCGLKAWFSPNEFPARKYLDPHWWPCLGRFKRCGLTKGNMSLRTGLEISKATYHSQCSLPYGYFQDGSSQLAAPDVILDDHAFPTGLIPLRQVTAHDGQLKLQDNLVA